MNVIYAIGKVKKKFKNAVLAIGVFDGVHRGHQALIRGAVRRAQQLGGEPLVMTFWPHPVHVLRPELGLPYIISLQHRLKLIEELKQILSDPQRILDIIKRELSELKEKYNDARRTKIIELESAELETEDLIKDEEMAITITNSG